MNKSVISALAILAVISVFLAYTTMDGLLREFSQNITFIDLGVLYILGLISGIALGLMIASLRKRPSV
jgi:hypothetical protein